LLCRRSASSISARARSKRSTLASWLGSTRAAIVPGMILPSQLGRVKATPELQEGESRELPLPQIALGEGLRFRLWDQRGLCCSGREFGQALSVALGGAEDGIGRRAGRCEDYGEDAPRRGGDLGALRVANGAAKGPLGVTKHWLSIHWPRLLADGEVGLTGAAVAEDERGSQAVEIEAAPRPASLTGAEIIQVHDVRDAIESFALEDA